MCLKLSCITYLGDRRVVTEMVFVFVDFGDYDERRKNGTKLTHMDNKRRMFLEQDMAPEVKIVSTFLGLSYNMIT